METDCSQTHQPGNSILGEFQVSLCEETMKRHVCQIDEIAEKKSKKKRRSSLSSHRRSITGDIVPAFQLEAESSSQGISESSSQKTTSDDSPPEQDTNTNQPCSRLPNPVNLQMDAIIDKMRNQIDTLDNECKQWGHLLVDFEQQEEASKQLSLNLTLSGNDIPADVKELGVSEYITSKPIDLRSVNNRVEKMLLQYKFDKESCLQDLQLINETAETIRSTNKYFQSKFYHVAGEVINAGTDNPEAGARTADSRQTILGYQDCA